MASIYTQKNSPYYWIRYYDILEHEPSKKRKSLNSKIPITPADQRRIEEAKKKSSSGGIKVNCDSPVWKNKPRCN